MITAVAAILHDQISVDTDKRFVEERPEWRVFNEQLYCGSKADDTVTNPTLGSCTGELYPTVEEIRDFIGVLYDAAEYSPECNVLALLFINRLIAFSGMPLRSSNWRPLVFTAVIVAQKVWDDQVLTNASFAYLYPFFTVEEVNKMEAAFLSLLHFEVVVKPSTYAKYYFELRSMLQDSSSQEPALPPISASVKQQLEARSARFQRAACRKLADWKAQTMS
ncbi:cyclin, N-terminal domain-containing protein [Besnoitia besnoiti]|uniref:Cyclin, N-terminal domain-containing protein n=1 Tax=Besnoitia besnoiti TaxID=94643 RepID=A0A2A9MHW3_BESBE|nr:cyclin, N-terminal domain-containing protein [Besnoitia besnoiti]PFH36784.1 cyclin, N-terminal domain-containing protein [Besnoitia besnoiti]